MHIIKALRFGVFMGLLAAAYFWAVRLGLGFRFQNSQVTVIFPAKAVLVAALLLTSPRQWWGVLVLGAAAHVAVMVDVVPVWRWIWQIACVSGFAICIVIALRRWCGVPLTFGTRRQAFVYLAVTIVMSTLFGLATPAFTRSVLHLELFSPLDAIRRTALSTSSALLLITPAVLLCSQIDLRSIQRLRASRVLEALSLVISLVVLGMLTLTTASGPPVMLLAIFPPLLWAAMRFGPTGATLSLLLVGALSIWGSDQQLGLFTLATRDGPMLSLQLFWLVLATPVLLLAAAVRETDEAADALLHQRSQLAHVTRVATAGTLSGLLAHELRQPLTAILANAHAGLHLLNAQKLDVRELRAILEDIAEQDQQAAGVISQVRSFVKKDEPNFQIITIETVLRNGLVLARGAIEAAGVTI
ncbi:MAG TPA: MASE1 domain-containing protein, partial [Longimicrobiales bacterium]